MRRVVYGGLGLSVLATGGYTVVYLARWEWQRSLMAGELLLICLIVLLAVAGVHRLQSMERRLTALIQNEKPRPLEAEEDVPRFRWLEADTHSYKVFIPVLLGAGIVVSGLAALVERAASTMGRSKAARVPEPLALPSGGVLAGAPEPTPRTRDLRVRLLWGTIALAVAALAVLELADHTQDRPDAPMKEAASTLILQVQTQGRTGASTTDPLANRLWEYCRGSTRPYLERGGVVPLDGQRYALVVQPALGEYALRRLRGCLQDTVIDHGRFSVLSVRHG